MLSDGAEGPVLALELHLVDAALEASPTPVSRLAVRAAGGVGPVAKVSPMPTANPTLATEPPVSKKKENQVDSLDQFGSIPLNQGRTRTTCPTQQISFRYYGYSSHSMDSNLIKVNLVRSGKEMKAVHRTRGRSTEFQAKVGRSIDH